MILTASTCVRALNMAALNRKTSFQIELAVGLAVFLSHGSTDKEARIMLSAAYSAAGYECTHVTGIDYKTVNRRMNATAKLFERLGGSVLAWAGKHDEDQLLSSICLGLEPYEFFGVQDVLRFCAPERVLPSRPRMEVKPAPDAIAPPPTTGQDGIREMFRRASDQGQRVEVGHLAVVIPQEATRMELMELARRLLEIAANTKDLLTA